MYVCGELVYAFVSGVFLYGVVLLFVSKKQSRLCIAVEQLDRCPGDVAQMVERSLSMRAVQGWIPCFSSEIMLP